MPSSSRTAALAVALLLLCVWGSVARAHVVLGGSTLRQSIQHADATAAVRFESGPRTWSAADGSDRQEYFRVRVLALLDGQALPESFDFFPHAEGFPDYGVGDRALLFLHATATRPEFSSLAERFPFHSEQGAGGEWKLEGAAGDAILDQARECVALEAANPRDRAARWRALVERGVASPLGVLRADARAELMLAARAPRLIVSAGQLAPFASLVEGSAPFQERAALQRLLESWSFYDASPGWAALRRQATEVERVQTLLTAAATSRDPATAAWLAGSLHSADPRVRESAAQALARRGDPGFVPALAGATADPEPRVARAAIRGLGAVGDTGALAVLEAVRDGGGPYARWAAVELRKHAPSPPTP